MSKFKFISRFLALLSLSPLSALAAPLVMPEAIAPAPAGTSTSSLPSIASPKLGPVKLGVQFQKRPRIDDQKTIKDVGFGVKFSLAI